MYRKNFMFETVNCRLSSKAFVNFEEKSIANNEQFITKKTPENYTSEIESLSQMSNEALELMYLILYAPEEIIKECYKLGKLRKIKNEKTISRHMINLYLKKSKNISSQKINSLLLEIGRHLAICIC